MKRPKIIVQGKPNGEGMIVRYLTSKGTPVFGFGMPNVYSDTEWNLGPTWCYLIDSDKITLVDTGRIGNHLVLHSMLKSIGKAFEDIDRIIITHCHEDHDGNLIDILGSSDCELWAHGMYKQMISFHQGLYNEARQPDFPGSCCQCVMPDRYNKSCIPYLEKRSLVKIDLYVEDGQSLQDKDFSFMHTPGHSPDSICIFFEDEALFTGDTVLPQITPHPTLSSDFEVNRRTLPDDYADENRLYGLENYCKSLSRLSESGPPYPVAIFPGHRLFYNDSFNLIHNLTDRTDEIIGFHIDRCRNILEIINRKPAELESIAREHFSQSSLAGVGMTLARNEIMSHIEIMEKCGDVIVLDSKKDMFQSTGSENCLDMIGSCLWRHHPSRRIGER